MKFLFFLRHELAVYYFADPSNSIISETNTDDFINLCSSTNYTDYLEDKPQPPSSPWFNDNSISSKSLIHDTICTDPSNSTNDIEDKEKEDIKSTPHHFQT